MDQGSFVPTFEIIDAVPPENKARIITLEVGECVDVYDCNLSRDGKYIDVDQYTISNIEGLANQVITESYIIRRLM